MPLHSVAGRNQQNSDRTPAGTIALLFCALILLPVFCCHAQEVDPPPPEEELLTIPPGNGPTTAGNPFRLVPSMPENFRVIGEDYETRWDAEKELIFYKGNMQCRTNDGMQLFADNVTINLK